MASDSPFKKGCKKKFQTNVWIAAFHNEEPLTIECIEDKVEYLRKHNVLTFQITLTHCLTTQATHYEEHRSFFDNFRPITAKGQDQLLLVSPVANYAVQLPLKPVTPATWADLKNDPNREYWYQAIYERYTKNFAVGLWSIPISRAFIPKNAVVLPAVSTFKIKPTEAPDIWDFYFRLCANGSKMIKGKDYKESHAPTGSHTSIRIMCALAAALNLDLYGLNVDNAFQCTPKEDTPDNRPLYITMPPLYFSWFKKYFPHIKLEGIAPFVLQCLTQIQGTRPAGRGFYQLMKALFGDIGIRPTSVDGGFYAYVFEEKHLILVCSETDDFLVGTDSPKDYRIIRDKIHDAFGITLQSGPKTNYLNFQIIVS